MIAGQKTGQPKAFPKLGAQGRSILISFSFLLLIFWQENRNPLIQSLESIIVHRSREQSGKGGKPTGEANGNDLAQA